MGRRLLAIGLAVALQGGALTAPLVHAHLDDHHDDHHQAFQVHAHTGGHAAGRHDTAGGPAVHAEESPERVVALSLFVATYGDAGIEPALAPAPFVVEPSSESLMRRPPQLVRSHGPPPVDSSAPRAPPAAFLI